MTITGGIDVGAGTVKGVLIEDGLRIVTSDKLKTGALPSKASEQVLEHLLGDAGIAREQLDYLVATGFGRTQLRDRDLQVTDITCNGRGATFLFPNTRSILDMGAQTTRGIRVDESGRVTRFKLNDRCAAGSGRFIERVARALETDLDTVVHHALQGTAPTTISSVCAVLGESEVINHLAAGHRIEDILMGLHLSIGERSIMLLRQVKAEPELTLTGGMVNNKAMIKALRTLLDQHINVHPNGELAAAIGAALLAKQRHERIREGDGALGGPRAPGVPLLEAPAASCAIGSR